MRVGGFIFRALSTGLSVCLALLCLSVPVRAQSGPEVRAVSIPDEAMGQGDVVVVTISFESYAGTEAFIYLGGTIESEVLDDESLEKVNDTTYTATFTIRETTPNRAAGESIRVRDLQFSGGGEAGPLFSGDIMQANDPIDTRDPVVYYILFEDAGPHIIGSPIKATVRADQPGYQFDLSRSWINGVSFSFPRVETEDLGDSTYRVTYTPMEGDEDVPEGETIEVEIVMLDEAGNRNQPPCSSIFDDLSPVIDANSAWLDSAVVRNPGVFVSGEVILIDLYASEILEVPDPPLEGSHVNFVPISSSRVNFRHTADLVYELSYIVGSGDNGVRSGELAFNLEMEDMAGNRSHSNITLTNNDVSIGTGRPTATITGGGSVCEGDSLAVYLYLTGESPWDVVVENRQGVYATVNADHSPLTLWIKSEEANTFTVKSVVDGTGTTGNTFGTAILGIYQSSPVEILLDQSTYLSSDPGVELKASLEPGVFTGNGVSGGYFYPSLAGTEKSPHSISYHYRNDYGCSTYDTALINVVEGSGNVVLLSGEDTISILCDDQGSYQIEAENEKGFPGSFKLRITNTSTEVPGHIIDDDPGDNRAVFNPEGLSGGYDIIYDFEIDGVALSASTYVRLELISSMYFVSGPGDVACKNDEPYVLVGNLDHTDPLSSWSFSGPGVSGSMLSGYTFDPSAAEAEVGLQTIIYEYVTEGGCRALTGQDVTIAYVPTVKFGVNTICIAGDGGEIGFQNTTSGKFSVENWSWDFGDYASGPLNYSSEENPVHFYSRPGQKSINLTATTYDGCISYHQMDTLLADSPDVDFTWISDCFSRGSDVIFVNTTDASYSSLDTLVWSFRTDGGSVLGVVGAKPGEDSIRIPFTTTGSYGVDLYVKNLGGCDATASRRFLLQPTKIVSESGLHESFDASDGGWVLNSSAGDGSWVRGVPDFMNYWGSQSDRAWYTDLPQASPGYTEDSWIESPCYDFSDLKKPMIRVDIMKSFLPDTSGAVLQYRDVVDEGWKTIGLYDEGLGWYNAPSILQRPGGSAYGWGLNSLNPDTAWVSASHALDMLAGKDGIRLRFAIGTHGEKDGYNQGFAINNLQLMNRNRKAVLEHFTNSGDTKSALADQQVDDFYEAYKMDLIDLQYHQNYPGSDPMNENNPAPASTRAGSLGVGQVPYSVLNGSSSSLCRYDFSTPDFYPDGEQLMKTVMSQSPFMLKMAMDWQENNLQATVRVQCTSDSYDNNLQLYVVVIESELTSYTGENGDRSFRNVVLDMLPTPAGKLLGSDWWKGKVEERTYSWDYASYVEDVEELGVVAFVQDRETGEILQATNSHMDSGLGISKARGEVQEMSLWPNPARDLVNVSLGENPPGGGMIMLMDISGRSLKEWQTEAGKQDYSLNLQGLDSGYYMLCWFEEGRLKGRASLVNL